MTPTQILSYLQKVIVYIYDNEDDFIDTFFSTTWAKAGYIDITQLSFSSERLYMTIINEDGAHILDDANAMYVLSWYESRTTNQEGKN